MIITTSKVLAAIQAKVDELRIEVKRANLLAGHWDEEPRISALSAEDVEREYRLREGGDEGWKSEDYDTVSELEGTIGGLELAMRIIRDVEAGAA